MGRQRLIGSTGLAMPKINIRGVKLYNSRGNLYAYHRATGIRIKSPIGTAEFFAELKRAQDKVSRPVIYAGTWGALKRDYLASPKYLSELSARTRKDYRNVLDWIGVDDMPVQAWDRGFVVSLRDKAQHEKGRRFANYVPTVVSLIFNWAADRQPNIKNPAEKIKKIKRPKTQKRANRPWTSEEWDAITSSAPAHLLPPILLWTILGWRKGESIKEPKTNFNARTNSIERMSTKSGREVKTPVPDILAMAIKAHRHDAITLLANSRGKPWSESGINASFSKFIAQLQKSGKVGEGITPHGGRHAAATRLREMGFDLRTIADVLGQEEEGMAAFYAREADLNQKMQGVVRALNKNIRRTKLSNKRT